ncbi:hypothetical protein ACQKP7_20475 [Pseudomonas frederiksbergensis]|uniref:hypothetical protein n=1 Tax=Pseudomonas frederiksbergensis TaxID=104087 RepID=UPI003D007513
MPLARIDKLQALIAERKKSAAHRNTIEELQAKTAFLASINEVLLDKIEILRSRLTTIK